MNEYLLIEPMPFGDYKIALYKRWDSISHFDKDYFVPGLPCASHVVKALNLRRIHDGEQPYPVFILDIATETEKPFISNI